MISLANGHMICLEVLLLQNLNKNYLQTPFVAIKTVRKFLSSHMDIVY
jgi:hypothetical protein